MTADQNKYPVFAANQVLTNAHLNQVFNYLDEQNRLTRANLIGIGVACGLEVSYDANNVHVGISRGCGVTSEGYLIQLPEAVELVSYKPFDLPDEVAYPPFTFLQGTPPLPQQYPIWEMFPVGEPDALPLTAAFLANKVVVLFLELKKDGLRNCSPNNCDDRGEEVNVTVRKLLFDKSDLDKIIALANGLDNGASPSDILEAMTAQMNLPDLRIRRFDVPNTSPATSDEVLIAFLDVFQKDNLATATGNALSALYQAFKPMLETEYPANPFTDFLFDFGFLDNVPATPAQVRFLQYYYDFFDDLLKAYDEFRWAGAELLCQCCPSGDLFPRHLMLGEVFATANGAIYRHYWMPSSASCCGCEQEKAALMLLFKRLVGMITAFTNTPPLPGNGTASNLDAQIRITPSKLADVPISEKCIPYYYTQNGLPPLYAVWNPEKTRRGRAKQNLSYRADEYAVANFVKKPLEYDLEPYNFLRIEGHLGKDYRSVLQTLIALKTQNRLPFEVIALRTGVFDEDIEIDLSQEDCYFQDLESQYSSLRSELLCFLCKEMQYFYNIETGEKQTTQQLFTPQEALLKSCAPNFKGKTGTLGAFFEQWLFENPNAPYNNLSSIIPLINNAQGNNGEGILFYVVYLISYLAKVLPENLNDLDCDTLEARYLDLEQMAVAVEGFWDEGTGTLDTSTQLLGWEEIDDRIEAIMFACKLASFKAVCATYEARIRALKEQRFLSYFLQKHPGVQHKAGVPMGGTFILAYHEDPPVGRPDFNVGGVADDFTVGLGQNALARRALVKNQSSAAIYKALNNLQQKGELAKDPDMMSLFFELTGQLPLLLATGGKGGDEAAIKKIVADTVTQFANGTVIADFYLPYICCSDCAPVQYTLPQPALGFTFTLGCTVNSSPTNQTPSAQLTITPQGGVAPYAYRIGSGSYQPLNSTIGMPVGLHLVTIQDSQGVESPQQTILVPGPLVFEAETYQITPGGTTYQVVVPISGGVPPYSLLSANGTFVGNTLTSDKVENGGQIALKVVDSAGCQVSKDFSHQFTECNLPCDGVATKCGYRFWIPQSSSNAPYKTYAAKVLTFAFKGPNGDVDISNAVQDIIQASDSALSNNFNAVVNEWIAAINNQIALKTPGFTDWLRLEYVPSTALNGFGTLMIEHFQCLDFKIIIDAQFQKPDTRQHIETTYTPGFTAVNVYNVDGQITSSTTTPVSGCTTINKCDPNRTDTTDDRCKDVDLKAEIKVTQRNNTITLNAQTTGTAKAVAYQWSVEDGAIKEPNAPKTTVNFDGAKPGTKRVALTITTDGGCLVKAITTLELPDKTLVNTDKALTKTAKKGKK